MSAPSSTWRRRGLAATLVGVALVGTVGVSSAQAAAGFTFGTRLEGPTRVETAVATSKALYPTAGTATAPAATDVVLVSQFAVVDGLTASYLAGLKNAPILYTDRDSVPTATADELKRLGVKNIWVVGGTSVVSQALEDSWKGTYTVKRYSGDDRYATAAAVATAGEFQPERVFITSGTSLADAVVAGPISWARNYPILLTKADSVPTATSTALSTLGTPERTVVGGTTAVNDATYGAVAGTKRLAGDTRQATAVAVAEDAVATANFTFANAALVGGAAGNAVDALSASSIAGNTGTPLLYIQGNDTVGAATAAYLTKHKANLVGTGYVLGGTSAVSAKAATEAAAAAQ